MAPPSSGYPHTLWVFRAGHFTGSERRCCIDCRPGDDDGSESLRTRYVLNSPSARGLLKVTPGCCCGGYMLLRPAATAGFALDRQLWLCANMATAGDEQGEMDSSPVSSVARDMPSLSKIFICCGCGTDDRFGARTSDREFSEFLENCNPMVIKRVSRAYGNSALSIIAS